MSDLSQSTWLTLLATGLFMLANPAKTRQTFRILFLAGLLIVLLMSVAFQLADFFTNRGIDESVVFHLIYGFKGAGFSEYFALIAYVILALLLSIMVVLIVQRLGRYGVRGAWPLHISLLVLALSLVSHPVSGFLLKRSEPLSFTEKFEDYYRTPVVETGALGNRKNLVYIYAEGLERTWFNEVLFPGLTPGLSRLANLAIEFTNIRQMPFTSWTMAGIVASQCGLPLVIPSTGISTSGTDQFLPGATCMGDILRSQGYTVLFYGGADLSFGGKGNFLQSHGFTSVNGKWELVDKTKQSELSGWGLYDEDLLKISYDEFEELSTQEQPFALFMLTLDTHHPAGIPSKSCLRTFSDLSTGQSSMHLAVRCSDHLLTRFIDQIRESPYSEQTLVVLASDHLARNNVLADLLETVDRKELLMILPGWSRQTGKIDIQGSIFDVGATVLGFLGIDTLIGFGRNLRQQESLFSARQDTQDLFRFWSNDFYRFWEFPNLGSGIIAMPSKQQIRIAKHLIKTPVLIRFDKNLDTQLIFDFNFDNETEKLEAEYHRLEIETPFAYIAECGRFEAANKSFNDSSTCLLLGKKGVEDNVLIQLRDGQLLHKQLFEDVIKMRGFLQ